MLHPILVTAALLLALQPTATPAVEARAIWDSRCEHCHGDPAEFSGKYLWNVGGQLQGRHHIQNLHLFLGNHYIPDHMVAPIRDMLLVDANSPARFATECGECHGGVETFVDKSLWVRGSGITGMETGMELDEFLPTHRNLQAEDVDFYLRLLARVANTPRN